MQNKEKILNTFLYFLIISLVGNACADFAMIWFAVGKLSGMTSSNSELLSSFYIGQAIGIILLAPILAAIIDQFNKRDASILLDLVYASFLLGLLCVHWFSAIEPSVLFPFAIVTAALGALHKSAAGFGALKSLSQELGITSLVSKFNAALFFTNLVGSAISGFMFKWLGLTGCLTFAILTFLPMPFIYFKLFPKASVKEQASVIASDNLFAKFLTDLRSGLVFIASDKLLLMNAVCLAVMNFASNIYPGAVAIAYQNFYPGKSEISAGAISVSILLGAISYKPLSKIAPGLSIKRIFPIALVLPIISIGMCWFFPNPFIFTLAFALQCCGAALINIMSGSIRVVRVPATHTARVNSAFVAIIYIGQVIGGLVLVPALHSNLEGGALMIAVSFTVSTLLAWIYMPSTRLSELIATKVT